MLTQRLLRKEKTCRILIGKRSFKGLGEGDMLNLTLFMTGERYLVSSLEDVSNQFLCLCQMKFRGGINLITT